MVNMVKFEVNRRAQMATVYKITQKRHTIIRVNRIILLYDCESITIIVREAAVQAGYGRRRNDGCRITVQWAAVVMFGRRLSLPV